VVKTLAARWRRHGDDPLAMAAKRVDTAATIAPSVASGLILAAGAQLTSQRGQEAWQTSRAEAGARGNVLEGGWTEAAMAGALGVKLDAEPEITDWESDTNPEGRNIENEDIENARQLFWIATAWAVAATLAAVILRGSFSRRR
jgi:cobalamin biosynthesis protein CobD/CbiB